MAYRDRNMQKEHQKNSKLFFTVACAIIWTKYLNSQSTAQNIKHVKFAHVCSAGISEQTAFIS